MLIKNSLVFIVWFMYSLISLPTLKSFDKGQNTNVKQRKQTNRAAFNYVRKLHLVQRVGAKLLTAARYMKRIETIVLVPQQVSSPS